jgi:hypothetical protein
MSRVHLKEFFENKAMMKAWADFIIETLNEEALERVYKGKETAAIKEAHTIISKSFKELAELFTEKPKPRTSTRAE